MLKVGGGGTNSFGVVLIWELEALAILKGRGGGRKQFTCFKKRGGGRNDLPCLERRGLRQKFRTSDFPILYPPPHFPINNNRSLTSQIVE